MLARSTRISWVGQIPTTWLLENMGKYVTQVKETNTGRKEKNLLSLSYGNIVRKDINANNGLLPASFEGYNIVEKDDIVLRLTDLQNDQKSLRVGHVTERGIITSAYITIRPHRICSDYLSQVLHAFDFCKGFYGMGSGVRQGLNFNDVKSLVIPVPPLDEQHAIADYLDERCAKIDAVIAESKKSIEEYKELKQAVISNAILCGLNKGIEKICTQQEWLKYIPSDWKLLRGKFLFEETNERSMTGREELLTVSQYTGITPRSEKNVNMFQSTSLIDYKICHIGDIAANTMWMWAGAVGVSEYYGVISPSYNTYRQTRRAYNDRYLDYLLRTPEIVREYASLSTGIRASRLRLYPKQFLNIRFPVPPMNEQIKIVSYLDARVHDIDSLISEKQSLVNDLEAYKKSLIYEVVTGKRRIN